VSSVVFKRPGPKRDFLDHFEFIGRGSLNSAERFLKAAEAAFEQRAEMPGMGRRWATEDPRLMGIRVWPIPRFRNYLIFYRLIESGIEVIHVLHGSRDFETLLEVENADP
jgi:toxin ParE1/3/4